MTIFKETNFIEEGTNQKLEEEISPKIYDYFFLCECNSINFGFILMEYL